MQSNYFICVNLRAKDNKQPALFWRAYKILSMVIWNIK